ncbi:MAG: hypothetical protein ACLPY1_17860 [Terracidiphilus sp.]
MGIGPIVNLMPLPLARSIQAALDPLPMERVEHSARTRDESYSPNGGRYSRGSEDNGSEDDLETFERPAEDEAGDHSGEFGPPRVISFFA